MPKFMIEVMKKIRATESNDGNKPLETAFYRHGPNWLAVYFVTKPCWWLKSAGGCTECSYDLRNASDNPTDVILQLNNALDSYFQNYGIDSLKEIMLFNRDFFDDKELTVQDRDRLLRKVASIESIKSIQIETYPRPIEYGRLRKIKEILNGKKLFVYYGLESSNDFAREYCLNKISKFEKFSSTVESMKELSFDVGTFVLFKPPFLSEKESIEDVNRSIEDITRLGVDKISIQVCNVQPRTLVHYLWKSGNYKTGWLWSVLEILKNIENSYGAHISAHAFDPSILDPKPKDYAKNCSKCTMEVRKSIKRFNSTQNSDSLNEIDCQCKGEWKKELETKNGSLHSRIFSQYQILSRELNVNLNLNENDIEMAFQECKKR